MKLFSGLKGNNCDISHTGVTILKLEANSCNGMEVMFQAKVL
jgi:hypothetical protein